MAANPRSALTQRRPNRYNQNMVARQAAGPCRTMTVQNPSTKVRSLRCDDPVASPRRDGSEIRTRHVMPCPAEIPSRSLRIGGAIALVAVPSPG